MERREYLLIGVSADGFASLLDVETGEINASLPLPPPAHLRRNTNDEEEAYRALVGGASLVHTLCIGCVRCHSGYLLDSSQLTWPCLW